MFKIAVIDNNSLLTTIQQFLINKSRSRWLFAQRVKPKRFVSRNYVNHEWRSHNDSSIAMKTLKLFRNPVAFEFISDKEEYNLTPREIEV